MLCPGAQAPAPMLPIALTKEKNKMNGTLTVKCSGQSGLNSLLTPWGKGQTCNPTGPRQVPQKGSAVSWWSALRTGGGSCPQSGHEQSAHPRSLGPILPSWQSSPPWGHSAFLTDFPTSHMPTHVPNRVILWLFQTREIQTASGMQKEDFLEAAMPQWSPGVYPRWPVPHRGNQRKGLPDGGRLAGPAKAKEKFA